MDFFVKTHKKAAENYSTALNILQIKSREQ